MWPARLSRSSGLAAMLGGVLWIMMLVPTPPSRRIQGAVRGSIALLLAALLCFAAGAVGSRARQRQRAGHLWTAAAVLVAAGVVAGSGTASARTSATPADASAPPHRA